GGRGQDAGGDAAADDGAAQLRHRVRALGRRRRRRRRLEALLDRLEPRLHRFAIGHVGQRQVLPQRLGGGGVLAQALLTIGDVGQQRRQVRARERALEGDARLI